MAEDLKYGKVTLERGNIPDDEPVIVFRARDKVVPKLLAYYHLFCVKAGSPDKHLNLIMQRLREIEKWQSENETKIPSSDSFK